ncbi:MAG: helix-turn-helix transcriptional regulator [Opitutaceae bacterium]|jgi:DNA-binding XRE family transcriptional regulator
MAQKVPVSQQDLSGRLAAKGIVLDRTAIARIESGTRYVLDYEAVAIAAAFRITVAELFGAR